MTTAQVVLPGHPSSVPTARHFVESILTSWGRPAQAWDAALLVSELAANCALHARTDFSIRVSLQGAEVVRIEVDDASPRIPTPRSYGLDATTGRGLRLVEQLSREWGVQPRSDGKTVWVELTSAQPGRWSTATADLPEDDLLRAFSDEPAEPAGPVARAA